MIRQLRVLALILFTRLEWPGRRRSPHNDMPRDLAIEAEAPPGPFPEPIRPAPIARTLILGITIHTPILATTRTRRGTTQASDLVLDSAGREQCGARLAMGTPTVIRTRTHTDIRPHMDIRTLHRYPSSVYVRPAPNSPVVVERDQQQPPPSRADEQAGFGTLSVRVNPPDAVILIDGEVWDRSPGDNRFSIELAEGVHQIEIRKEGYGSYARTIDVYRGRVSTLNVGLTPRGAVLKPTSLVVVTRR